MTAAPYVYFEDQLAKSGAWKCRLYKDPVDLITAQEPTEINEALYKLQQAHENGYFLAGYFSYELGYCFEPKLKPLLPTVRSTPLIQFGVFKGYKTEAPKSNKKTRIGWMTPDWMRSDYLTRFDKVLKYIKAGDVYQINLTFPLRGSYKGNAASIYNFLKKRQPVQYGGVVSLGGDAIVTLSPELFFETRGRQINMRPMKGTIKRGTDANEDRRLAEFLQKDPKNRAENLMIVDLLRNDLSRLSKPGSVKVDELFKIETYPSLHTMTSSVSAELRDSLDIKTVLKGLFPCGSVTGAPKIRAMEIINELEERERAAYCGAIGMIDPDKPSHPAQMRFNVAIRTLRLGEDGSLTYPVGSGIVMDSDGGAEYEECLLKAAFLTDGNFDLIETMGWHEQTGFMHLDLHLERLAGSAFTFGFAFPETKIKQTLEQTVKKLSGPHKVRLTLAHDGSLTTRADRLTLGPIDKIWQVAVSKNRLKSRDRLLRHKTTNRRLYDNELARIKDRTNCHEAIFFNEKDQLCEGSFTNVFVKIDGKLCTPPLRCGLLPGILRKVLITTGEAKVRELSREDLLSADAVYVGNAARGLIKWRPGLGAAKRLVDNFIHFRRHFIFGKLSSLSEWIADCSQQIFKGFRVACICVLNGLLHPMIARDDDRVCGLHSFRSGFWQFILEPGNLLPAFKPGRACVFVFKKVRKLASALAGCDAGEMAEKLGEVDLALGHRLKTCGDEIVAGFWHFLQAELASKHVIKCRLEKRNKCREIFFRSCVSGIFIRAQKRHEGFSETRQIPVPHLRLASPGIAALAIDRGERLAGMKIIQIGTRAVINCFTGNTHIVRVHDAVDKPKSHPARDQVRLRRDDLTVEFTVPLRALCSHIRI